MVGGLGHLYLNPARDKPPGPARPVCGFAQTNGASEMDVNAGDSVCPTCDDYVYQVYLPQIG